MEEKLSPTPFDAFASLATFDAFATFDVFES
jgi:hypothetical protein